MRKLCRLAMLLLLIMNAGATMGQKFNGKIVDAQTRESIEGASVQRIGHSNGTTTDAAGNFTLNSPGLFSVSVIGYKTEIVELSPDSNKVIAMNPVTSSLQEVVFSANRDAVKRSLAPVAISAISSKMIKDAKPVSIDQVLNKVSGVNMVNLGNEQHQMSIRLPMTTRALFLYLEDGIPIRTSGLFNHNALLEINMAGVKSIEVIKGPSSSLYGSEAIGGVINFITQSPSTTPVTKLSLQGNTIGYKRLELQSSVRSGKWGFALSGYYARKENSFIGYTDFHKAILTAKADYHFSKKTTLNNSVTRLDYYSEMTGSVDSSMFARHTFTSLQTFTYRQVKGWRYRSSLVHNWSENGHTILSVIYRHNSIGQNPAYSIRNDYRRLPNDSWTGNRKLAHGEINDARFSSYVFTAMHRQQLAWKNAVVIGGLSIDLSPSAYKAEYIRIKRDSSDGKYTAFEKNDSLLTKYKTGLNNYAAYVNWEFDPVQKLRIVLSFRYDLFHYGFNNHLAPSAFSGAQDTTSVFRRITPKAGFTYNFSTRTGIYANYSEGFVPPQVTELYKGVKVPDLSASVFYNYEIGGWWELVKNKLSADISVYRLDGTNEIIAVRLDDGSTENRNAGKTLHKGIEMGIKGNPLKELTIRFAAAVSHHRFVQYTEKGTSYDRNEMNAAPRWFHNAEIGYQPSFIKGLRLSLEWQKQGSYFMDALNTAKYGGYNVFHVRAAYQWKELEIWANLMNATDNYFSYLSTRSNSGNSYTPAEPRHLNLGVCYDFGKMFK